MTFACDATPVQSSVFYLQIFCSAIADLIHSESTRYVRCWLDMASPQNGVKGIDVVRHK